MGGHWPGYTQNATSFPDFTEVSLKVFFAGVLNRFSPDIGKAGINLRSADLIGNTFFERFRLLQRLYMYCTSFQLLVNHGIL
jgi:hypothetical protein